MVAQIVPIRRVEPSREEEAPSAAELEAKVHQLARQTSNLVFDHPHFKKQMIARTISMRQVLEVLREGNVIDGPTKDQWGDWRVKLQRRVAGRRVQIVVAVKEKHLDMVTAI